MEFSNVTIYNIFNYTGWFKNVPVMSCELKYFSHDLRSSLRTVVLVLDELVEG